MSDKRRRWGTLHCKNPDQLLDGIEVRDTDPPDPDELYAAVNALLDRADKAASSIVLAQELKRVSKAMGR